MPPNSVLYTLARIVVRNNTIDDLLNLTLRVGNGSVRIGCWRGCDGLTGAEWHFSNAIDAHALDNSIFIDHNGTVSSGAPGKEAFRLWL